nr:hypothetical protein [Streptomyces sp. LaPpAH-108]
MSKARTTTAWGADPSDGTETRSSSPTPECQTTAHTAPHARLYRIFTHVPSGVLCAETSRLDGPHSRGLRPAQPSP